MSPSPLETLHIYTIKETYYNTPLSTTSTNHSIRDLSSFAFKLCVQTFNICPLYMSTAFNFHAQHLLQIYSIVSNISMYEC